MSCSMRRSASKDSSDCLGFCCCCCLVAPANCVGGGGNGASGASWTRRILVSGDWPGEGEGLARDG